MSKHSFRFVILSAALLLAFLVSLAQPMTVYADDGTPPPTATEEPVQPPVEEPTEAPVDPVEVTPTEVPAEPPAAEEVTVGEILEAAPEGTEVVVLDETGEALPLVSEEAADIVASTDPIWCPEGQNPGNDMDDGVQNCSNNFATPQDLINSIDSSNPKNHDSMYEQNGTIYFTANPGGAFVLIAGSGDLLEGADYAEVKKYNLTLQGGWNGQTGSLFTLSGQSDFGTNRVQIGTSGNPWAGNITINNISIDGVTDNSGLIVYTNGNIALNNVNSGSNAGSGAYLNNTSGTGAVSIQNSTFNDNLASPSGAPQSGLRVASNGNIVLFSVSANNNSNNGAQLDTTTGSGSISVSSSTFNGNAGRGVGADANGNITLASVLALANVRSGAELDNTTGSGLIDLSSSTFSDNGSRGVVADSNGNITLANIIATGNTTSGAQLHNDALGTGSITVSSSIFSNNQVDGLEAYSNGDITVTDVTADQNGEIGASLINDSGEGNVDVTDSSFSSNTSVAGMGQNMGLEIASSGDVTLSSVVATGNTGGNGSSISGFGSLLIETSTFNGNDNGVYLEGDEAEVVCSQFNSNASYGIDGLNVFVTFTLDDVTFTDNAASDYLGVAFILTGGCSTDEGGGDEGGGDEGGGDEGGGDEGGEEEGGEEEGEEGEESEEESVSSEPGTTIPVTALPLHVVSVAGGEQTQLDCNAYSGTKLILPNGDSIILPCPLRDQASLQGVTQDALPGSLDDAFGFMSAMDAQVIRDGEVLSTLDSNMTVEFVIPEGQQGSNLAVLRWDGSQWVEVTGSYATADGQFVAGTAFTGTFVLVTK